MAVKINKRLAKSISYGGKRDLNDVKYIVIHYTGNDGDTAKNNADYFATGNKTEAGAHFFVDKKGEIWNSIEIDRTAWAVGGFFTQANGAGKYYKKCTNPNSVSIELCDCVKGTNWEQMVATRKLVLHIQKKCPNAKTVIRHFDVNGKQCPASMAGTGNEQWKRLHNYLTKRYQFKAKIIKNAAIRSSGKVTANNKIGSKKKGDIVYVTKIVGNWGRLKKKSADGKWRWISLKKVKEI